MMLPLSMSYDHRVINGADAAKFTRFVADRLESGMSGTQPEIRGS
jgi:pyruvate dehydrogenase E2 component (dihydrolipoamide acetyltransferase)